MGKHTEFHRNPFYILGATTRDDRRRILELAENRALRPDYEICQKARADLTNPRTRLAAEMAWLPGVSPKKADQLANQVLRDPMTVRSGLEIPTLAHANLMAVAFECVGEQEPTSELAMFVQEFAQLVHELDSEEILRDVNEDRSVSGFPEVMSLDLIDTELHERKRYYRKTVIDALDRMPPEKLVEIMTEAVDRSTNSGEHHAPELIDEIVDNYEIEAQGFLKKEAENVFELVRVAREFAQAGEETIQRLISKIREVARNWKRVAQPIQLSMKARGIQHQASQEMAYSIRGLAVDLCNDHDMHAQALRITRILQDLFRQLPELIEMLQQDLSAIEGLMTRKRAVEAESEEWAKEITYEAKIGALMFKKVLRISPHGIEWDGTRYPLDSITRVRWGGVGHSGLKSDTSLFSSRPFCYGMTYTIAFGDSRSEKVIELGSYQIYSTFVDKLWRAVCIQLMLKLLKVLQTGEKIPFGDALVEDEGIALSKHTGTWGAIDDYILYNWHQVRTWSADGLFYIGAKEDERTYVKLSYIHQPNVHILEHIVRLGFKKGIHKLTDLLKNP